MTLQLIRASNQARIYLDDLEDVTLAKTLTAGEALMYDGNKWTNDFPENAIRGDLEIADYGELDKELATADFTSVSGWWWSTISPYDSEFTVASNQGTLSDDTKESVTEARVYQLITTTIGKRYYATVTFKGNLSSGLSVDYPELAAATSYDGTFGEIIESTHATSFDQSEVLVLSFVAETTQTQILLIHQSAADVTGISVWEDISIKEVIGGDLIVRGDTHLNRNVYLAGGETNCVKVSTGGHMTFLGSATVWLDEKGQLSSAKITSPSSKVVQADSESAYYFTDSAGLGDYLWLNVQLNHDKKQGSAIYPHIHWWQSSSDVPNWLIQYRWQTQGGEKTTSWASAKYLSNAFTYTTGTLNQITVFQYISCPVDADLSDILQFRIIRDTGNSSTLFDDVDPVSGNVYICDFDVHKQLDSVGSNTEYNKST